jgi:hypothetical protein
MFGQQGTGMRITKLLIQDSGTYNNQWRRPYQTQGINGDVIGALQDRLAEQHVITAASVAGLAGQILAPQAQPESQVKIPNSWGERRMRFMMEVQTVRPTGGRIKEVVLGYTDYAGISHAGSIDPNMRFFINSIIRVRETPMLTPFGQQSQSSVIDSSHVLGRPDFDSVLTQAPEVRMRPVDVFTSISRTHLPDPGSILDTRVTQTQQAAFSKRGNNVPAQYLAELLQSYKLASMGTRDMGQAEQEVLNQARGYVAEGQPGQDEFLRAISQIRGGMIGKEFTYSDLMQLQPDVDSFAVVTLMGPTQRQQVHQVGQTAEWGGADRDTQVATYLSNAIPGLMMELALTQVVFQTTNHTLNGTLATSILDSNSFADIDISQPLQLFIHSLEHEIINDITMGGQIGIALKMQVDLLGETWINMSIDGGPFIDYVTPSFCDSLIVPVLTADQGRALDLAKDVENLTFAVVDPHRSTPQYPAGMEKPRF